MKKLCWKLWFKIFASSAKMKISYLHPSIQCTKILGFPLCDFYFNISLLGTPAPEEAAPAEPEAPAGAPKKGLKLSYDEYKQMANLMVLFMRKQEEESEGGLENKNISCLWDADWKFCHKGKLFGIRRLDWCPTVISSKGIFSSHRTTIMDSFLHTLPLTTAFNRKYALLYQFYAKTSGGNWRQKLTLKTDARKTVLVYLTGIYTRLTSVRKCHLTPGGIKQYCCSTLMSSSDIFLRQFLT